MSTPPNTTALRSGVCFAYACTFAATWSASSRVGVRISARTGWRAGDALVLACGSRRWMIGSEKLAVLPVPVCAAPMTSRPASTTGMACLDRRRRHSPAPQWLSGYRRQGRIDRRLRRRAWRQNRTWWRFAQKARRGHRASGQPGLRSSQFGNRRSRGAARRRSGAWDRFNVNAGRQAVRTPFGANAGGKGRIVALRGHLSVTTRRTATTAVRATGPGRAADGCPDRTSPMGQRMITGSPIARGQAARIRPSAAGRHRQHDPRSRPRSALLLFFSTCTQSPSSGGGSGRRSRRAASLPALRPPRIAAGLVARARRRHRVDEQHLLPVDRHEREALAIAREPVRHAHRLLLVRALVDGELARIGVDLFDGQLRGMRGKRPCRRARARRGFGGSCRSSHETGGNALAGRMIIVGDRVG